jgi:serum/glucocorticoid-regulated kinase 2
LCTGGELFYYLQKFQSFKLSSAKLLFAEVILALEFLHKNNILYRDLKPENILVDESGHLKLTDFGLCKLNFKADDLTRSFVGSPEYMSPEILLGKAYNYSVDFYTLGVLFYEMIVGLPPHYNEDKMQMYKDISYSELEIPDVLTGDIRDLLEGLLEKDPKARIGFKNGIEELKQHKFFAEIDWSSLAKKIVAPSTKQQRPPLDVNIFESNFDTEYTTMPIDIKPSEEEIISMHDPIEVAPLSLKRKRCNTFCFNQKISVPARATV